MAQQNSSNDLKKKKFKWWIPVSFFVGFFVIQIIQILMYYTTGKISNFNNLLSTIKIISGLLVFPSLIIVIILYATGDKKDNN